jgi:ligand-binding sensor domain-containing protein
MDWSCVWHIKIKWKFLDTMLDVGYVRTIKIDKKGDIWAGTDGHGLFKYNGTNVINYTTDNGLAYNIVTSIVFDSFGNNWIGTADVMGVINIKGGISKFDGTTWESYSTEDGLASNLVWDIAIDNQGNKWICTSNGVSKFDGTTWTNYDISYSVSDGFGSNYLSKVVISIFIDKSDNKWVGTHLGGLFQYDGTTWTSIKQLEGLIIWDIEADNDGNKWFGTNKGVFKFDGSTWTNYTTANGLINDNVYTIAIDQQNNKWFGTFEGLSKLTDTPVGISKNTLNDISIFPNPASNSITIDFPLSLSPISISIKDLHGIEVQKETLNLTTTTKKIDVSRLISGIYNITINSNDIRSTQRLVITR